MKNHTRTNKQKNLHYIPGYKNSSSPFSEKMSLPSAS
jgi:hypothetical protein